MRAFSGLQITVDGINTEDVARLTQTATQIVPLRLELTPKRGTAGSPGVYRATLTWDADGEELKAHIAKALRIHAALNGLTPKQAMAQVEAYLTSEGVDWDEPGLT